MKDGRTVSAEGSFLKLHAYLRSNDFRGYEFDDLLGSQIVNLLCGNSLLMKRIAIQAGELSPINLRPLLGVKKLESTKANGFFAKAYLTYYSATKDQRWLQLAVDRLEWLRSHTSPGYSGICWGNAFDFASRGGYFPKGTPTIVWTAHIADAFDLAYTITGNESYKDTIIGICRFMMNDLERREDEHGVCFAYAPGIVEPIHNSNLLGASTLLRGWRYCQDAAMRETAKRSYEWTLHFLNNDGSFYYGLGEKYQWIDNFHTAYNIDRLLIGHEIGGENIVPLSVIAKAYRFWVETFFLPDGTPKFYHNRVFPLDIQCAAQAIETLSKCHSLFPESRELSGRVVNWTIEHMQKRNGSYRYQIRQFWKNDLESIHWGQSTMFAALAQYLSVAD